MINPPVNTTDDADLNDVRTFVAVSDSQTITAAALQLRMPASTISRSIGRLEKRLGVTLAQRSSRGFVLTEIGQGYLLACRKALRALHDGADWIEAQRAQPTGVIRVACPITFARDILAPLLKSFLVLFPCLYIDIETYASNTDYSPADDVDVFFKIRRPRDSSRRMRSFPSNALRLFASKQYLKEKGTPQSVGELAEHSCVGDGVWRFCYGGREETFQPSFVVRSPDPHVHLTLVATGVGIGILPLWLAHRPDVKDQLTELLPLYKIDPSTMCALFFGRQDQTPKVQVFLDYLAEYIGTTQDPRLRGNWDKQLFPVSQTD